MLLHTPREEVTRNNPFKDGEEMTFTPEPKFTFINKPVFLKLLTLITPSHSHFQLKQIN